MKALHDRTQNPPAQGLAAGLAERVAAIFEECPALRGFSVQKLSAIAKERAVAPLGGELCLADVSLESWPGVGAQLDLYAEVVGALLELIDEQPEACDFLSGRTFARTLH